MLISIYMILIALIGIIGTLVNAYSHYIENKIITSIFSTIIVLPFYLIVTKTFLKGIL